MRKIAIFASGTGSNAKAIIQYFSDTQRGVQVVGVVTNNSNAGVLLHAENHSIETRVFPKAQILGSPRLVLDYLSSIGAEYIVLAGFMVLMPVEIVRQYSDRIFNIHPSLLPKFGGRGMYGMNVHRAVLEADEVESGITIHLVNDQYDKGRILFQTSTPIYKEDTPEILAARVLELEHFYYSRIIEENL
ncbi:MAG: phosphoribosylglycinamide formyltransferase [Rikenellaceae bacterium]